LAECFVKGFFERVAKSFFNAFKLLLAKIVDNGNYGAGEYNAIGIFL